ncbi:MAG: YraN family protein, partial [Acidobacteriota bacterium]
MRAAPHDLPGRAPRAQGRAPGAPVPAGHLTLGREGEDAAERLLRRAGMRVLERNFRCRTGELDLVCQHGDTI